MKKCWAHKHNPCSAKISREHLLTKGVFKQLTTRVQGFPWCREREKEVGISRLTAKILCKKHNNDLSPLDDVGIEASQVFYNASFLDNKEWEPQSAIGIIDGYLFERWLLKTIINLSFKSNYQIGVGMTDSVKGEPPDYLVAVVFGDIPFSHEMGLYLLVPKKSYLFQPGSFKFTPIHKNEQIGGFWIHAHGYDFFLSLNPGHALPTLRTLGLNTIPDHLLDASPIYRPEKLDSKTKKQLKCYISFQW